MSQTEITGILQEMRAEVQKMATSGVNPTQDIKDELQAIISGLKDIKASGFTTGGATSGDSSIKNELMDITAQMKSEIQKLQVELKNKPSPVVQNDVVCSDKVQKLEALVKELQTAEANTKKSHQEQIEKITKDFGVQLTAAKSEVKTVDNSAEITKLKLEIEKAAKEHQQAESQSKKHHQDEIDKITKDFNGQIATLKSQSTKTPVVDNSAEITKLKKDLEQSKADKEKSEKALAEQTKKALKALDIQKELDELKSQNQTTSKHLTDEQKKSTDLKSQVTILEDKIKKLESEKKVQTPTKDPVVVKPVETKPVTTPVKVNTPEPKKEVKPVVTSSPVTTQPKVSPVEVKKVSDPVKPVVSTTTTTKTPDQPKLSKIQERMQMLQKSSESPNAKTHDPVDIYKK